MRSMTGANSPEMRVPASSAPLTLGLAPEAAELARPACWRPARARRCERLLGDGGQRARAAAALARGAPATGARSGARRRKSGRRRRARRARASRRAGRARRRRRGCGRRPARARRPLTAAASRSRATSPVMRDEHVAVAAAVERVGLEALQMREELRAQREREPLADPRGGVLVAERQQRPEQREADHGRHEDGERAERLGHEHVVDDQLEQPDLGGLDCGQQRGERDAGHERPAVRPRQRPERGGPPRAPRPQGPPRRHGRRRGPGASAAARRSSRLTGSGVGVPAAVAATATPAAALAGVRVAVAVGRGEPRGGADPLERTMGHDGVLSLRCP